MTRIFRRGELRTALLHVLGEDGPANGYAIMQRLSDHIGAGWRASPGAVYPALLALEDTGHIQGHDRDGSRLYELTASGRRLVCDHRFDLLDDIASRASSHTRRSTLGVVLDRFASTAADRSLVLDPVQERHLKSILTATGREIASVLNKEYGND